MSVPILRKHNYSDVTGSVSYVNGVLAVKFMPGAEVTRAEFFEIFGDVGVRITEWKDAEHIVQAEILEFSTT